MGISLLQKLRQIISKTLISAMGQEREPTAATILRTGCQEKNTGKLSTVAAWMSMPFLLLVLCSWGPIDIQYIFLSYPTEAHF